MKNSSRKTYMAYCKKMMLKLHWMECGIGVNTVNNSEHDKRSKY